MKDCSTCNKKHFCKQYYKAEPTRDSHGRIYDGTLLGYWLYDYEAYAYNHATKSIEKFTGTVRLKPTDNIPVRIAAHIRGQNPDAWLCVGAKRI